MQYRVLGRTQYRVSEIGFGAWGIGGGLWQDSDDQASRKALHAAIDAGVNFIDTALAYGQGHSEQLIGTVLQERGERVLLATKIPPMNRRWPAQKGTSLNEVFPSEYIVRCTEDSLQNLRVDCLDLQQLHVWNDEWFDEDELWETVELLKADGKIRFFGVSINDHEPNSALQVVSSGRVDTIQVIYNIFDRSPEDRLFPLCLQHNVGVIARVPFDEGALTGHITLDTSFPENDFRARYFRGERKRQVVERVEKLRRFIGGEAVGLPELALRFCLHNRAVGTVIPGMRTVEHVHANCSVSDGRMLSAGLLSSLREHRWEKNFYH